MERYINSYATGNDVQAAIDNEELLKPYVAYIENEDIIDWNSLSPAPDYSKEYLTFEILSDGQIKFYKNNSGNIADISYSTDNGNSWNAVPGSYYYALSVISGQKILLKGVNNSVMGLFNGSTVSCNVYGNIMSLLYGDDFIGKTDYKSNGYYAFKQLFKYCSGIVSAKNLIIPLNRMAYQILESAFFNCSSLTIAPELPATTLANGCYQNMFYGCRSLNYIKCLATDISATNCTAGWVVGVASTGTFVKNPNMSGWSTGNSGIPTGWTVQDA